MTFRARIPLMLCAVLSTLVLGACISGSPPVSPASQSNATQLGTSPAPASVDVQDLAGSWEYEDRSGAYAITLDARGRGTYAWQDGEFQTESVNAGIWKGTWRQPGNDREGRFELRLARDRQFAEGRWWYTRIESDVAPLEPGGHFTLTRLPVELSAK